MKYKIRALFLVVLDLIFINASLLLAYLLRLDYIFYNYEYAHFLVPSQN